MASSKSKTSHHRKAPGSRLAPRRRQKKIDPVFRKRYIKLLSVGSHPSILRNLIRSAPVPVLKLISNAAIHASHGQVNLSNNQSQLFRKKKGILSALVSKKVPFNKKRNILIQRGGAISLIPTLLSAVLSSIGPLLFSNLTN